MEFHELIKELRIKKGATQQEVAYILQIDQSTYAHYESGRRTPDLEKLRLLATYYNLTDEILGVGYNSDKTIPPLYGTYYRFPNLFPDSPIQMERIYPTKQALAGKLREVLTPDTRIVSAVLFGSSITMRCNMESDTDIAVRLVPQYQNRETKNEVSKKILEVCDWNADIIWYDTLNKNERIYHDICKGVQIV